MPSPIIHSVAGLALARFLPEAPESRRSRLLLFALLAAAANAPDLDFIPGILVGEARLYHHGASHSLLAAGLFTLASVLLARQAHSPSTQRAGALLGLAYLTHLPLDMLSSWVDDRHGVALAWPFLLERFSFPFPVFSGISLDPAAGGFVRGLLHRHNADAVAWELVVVGVVWGSMIAIGRIRRSRSRETGKSSSRPSPKTPSRARRFRS